MEICSKVLRVRGLVWGLSSPDWAAPLGLQRRILIKGIVVLLVGLLSLSADPAYALRCGNRLVSVGDSPVEVLDKCGEPVSRDQWVVYRALTLPQQAPLNSPQQQVYVPVSIEEWVYNFGAHRFMQKFHFEDNLLREIQSLGYGE